MDLSFFISRSLRVKISRPIDNGFTPYVDVGNKVLLIGFGARIFSFA
jgi:hypothetical protein